jgi:hypothetical protein
VPKDLNRESDALVTSSRTRSPFLFDVTQIESWLPGMNLRDAGAGLFGDFNSCRADSFEPSL